MPDGGRSRPGWPRLLSREEAAEYVGVSATQFDKEVAAGVWPRPLDKETIRRVLSIREYDCRRLRWDRRALDLAVDRLSGLGNASLTQEQELDAGL